MKTKTNFLTNIRFRGTLTIVFLIVCVVLLCLKPSLENKSNNFNKNKIKDFEYGTFKNYDDSKDLFYNLKNAQYSTRKSGDLPERSEFLSSDVLMRATVLPVEYDDTFLLINTTNKLKNNIRVFVKGEELEKITEKAKDGKGDAIYNSYLLPKSETGYVIYFYADKSYGLVKLDESIILVGSKTDIIVAEGFNTVIDFVFAGVLLLLGLFIYIIFYITSIEKYYVVRVFASATFLLALQNIIFAPLMTYTFAQYPSFFVTAKTLIYFGMCSLTYGLLYLNTNTGKLKKFYKINIIVAQILTIIFIVSYNFNIFSVEKCAYYYNIYFLLISLYAMLAGFYKVYENAFKTILILLVYTSMVLINLLFFNYEMQNANNSLYTPYFFLLTVFTVSVICYIVSIFYYRSKAIYSTKLFLYEEQETINRLYNSNKNAITTTNIQQLCDNILSDIKEIYPNLKFAMVMHKDLSGEITVPAYTTGHKGDIDEYAKKIYKRNYKRIKKSSYITEFVGNHAYFTFRSSTGESLFIFVRQKETFKELDITAGKILASPILLVFNNCRIYGEIENTEKELLYAMGNITYQKSEGKGDIWRIGEYCYLLAKNTGLPETFAKNLRLSAYIYNIGKVGMSDSLINYSKISESDRQKFYKHTEIGYEMLSEFGGDTMQMASICSLYHHEHYNGTGYLGKASEDIPIEARILTICSHFDEYYSTALLEQTDVDPFEEGFRNLSINKQTLFDPRLVQLFIKDKKGIEDIIEKSNSRTTNVIE